MVLSRYRVKNTYIHSPVNTGSSGPSGMSTCAQVCPLPPPLPILGPLCLFSLHPPSYSFVVRRKVIMRLRCLGSLLLCRNMYHGSKALNLTAFPSVKILALRSNKILTDFEIHSHIPSFGQTRLCAQCCSYVVFHALTYSTYQLRGFNWKAFMTGVSEPRCFQAH